MARYNNNNATDVKVLLLSINRCTSNQLLVMSRKSNQFPSLPGWIYVNERHNVSISLLNIFPGSKPDLCQAIDSPLLTFQAPSTHCFQADHNTNSEQENGHSLSVLRNLKAKVSTIIHDFIPIYATATSADPDAVIMQVRKTFLWSMKIRMFVRHLGHS
jgi:hypothetical protein